MPSVIDALIITLELDPKKFTDGQRQATESLRRMEQDASKSARNIGDSGSKGFAVFFTSINKNFEETNQHLAQIATQTRRTGRSIADGGREGAAGLTNLTTAALGAFSAIKALQGLYKEVEKSAATGGAIGRIAPEIGGGGARSTGWIQQFANAAQVSVNANPAAIMEDLRSLEVDLQTFAKRGVMSDRLREMTIGGVNVSQSDTAETLTAKLERNLGSMSPEERAMRAQRYGLSRDFGRFTGLGPQGVDQAMAGAKDRNLTEAQIKQLERLQSAGNAAAQAYQHLWDAISADIGNSGLSKALEIFAKLADDASQSEVAIRGLEVAIGVGLVGGIAGLIRILQALGALPAWRALVGMAALAGGGASLLRFLGPVGAFAYGMAPGTAGNQAEIDAEKRLGGQARAAAGGVSPGAPTGGDPRGMEPIIRAAAAKYGIDPEVAMKVARSEGLGVFLGDHGKSGGAFQLYTGGGLGNQFQKETGLDPLDPKNEAATIDWAMKNLARTGWGPYHGAAHSGIANWQGIGVGNNAAAVVANARRAPRASDGGMNLDDLKDQYWQYNREHLDATVTWSQYVKAWQMRQAQAKAGNSASTTNNDIDHTTNIGKMEIHTQAKDADGIVGSMGNALRRKTMANQVNTGLE